MAAGMMIPTVVGVENLKQLHWPLIVGLGALALARPVLSIVGVMDRLGKPLTPLLVTTAISIVWILAVGLSRVAEPVLTLLFAGVVYGALIIPLSAIASIATGELDGPMTRPFVIVPILATNAIWGAMCGVLALALQAIRTKRPMS